uniref:Uncharacterized protein n=1 Tax=viral metagenome TaxID=1070528 RepID=A0A6M3INW7_9ZZZZ
MAEIPSITLETLRAKIDEGAAAVKALPSCHIINKYGDYVATLVVALTDYTMIQSEYMGVLSNSVREGHPFDEDETPKEEPPPKPDWRSVLREPTPSEYVCSKCQAVHRFTSPKGQKHLKYEDKGE